MATQAASAVAITGGTITGLGSPTNQTDAATKIYVDAALAGQVVWHNPPVSYAAYNIAGTAVLPNSPTYNNGAGTLTDGTTGSVLVVDGQTGANTLNTDILVANQVSPAQNGLYRVTTAGVAGVTKWVLTRRTDFNTVVTGNIALGAAILVTVGGTTNPAGAAFVMNQTAAITLGTTALTWAQIATGNGSAWTASTGVVIVGSDIRLATIAGNSIPVNASGSVGAPTSAQAYSATPATNTIPMSGAGSTLAAGWLPNPSASTLGGIESITCATHTVVSVISTGGVPSCTQLSFSNLLGSATLAQLPSIGNNTVLGNVSGGNAAPIALSQAQLITLANSFNLATGLTATGTTQGGALSLTANTSVVSTVPAGSGVLVNASVLTPGQPFYIADKGVNPLNIYPPSGGAIDALAANAPIAIAAGSVAQFIFISPTVIYSVPTTAAINNASVTNPGALMLLLGV